MKMIMLLVVAAGMLAAAFADASYSDAYIETDDPSVRRIDLGTEYVYVFTNATLGNVDVTFRRMLAASWSAEAVRAAARWAAEAARAAWWIWT